MPSPVLLLALSLALQPPPPQVPAEARALKERGDLLRAAGEPAAALVTYGQALERHGAYAEALVAKGEVLSGLRRYPEAVQALGAAVGLDPSAAPAWRLLAAAAARDGDLPRAREAYDRYAGLRPDDPDGHFGLAETARLQGDGPAAVAAYRRFLELATPLPAQAARVEQAVVQLAALSAAAEAAATPAPPSAPLPALPYSPAVVEKLAAGERAASAGDHRSALFLFQEAVYLAPTSAEARLGMARAYAGLRHPEKAEAQLRQVLTADPANREALRLQQELRAPPAAETPGPEASAGPPGSWPRVYKLTPDPPGSGPQAEAAPPRAPQTPAP